MPEIWAEQRAFLNAFGRKSAPIEADLCALESSTKTTPYDKYIQIKALLANKLKPLEDTLIKAIDAEMLRAALSPSDDDAFYAEEDDAPNLTTQQPIHRTLRIKPQ